MRTVFNDLSNGFVFTIPQVKPFKHVQFHEQNNRPRAIIHDVSPHHHCMRNCRRAFCAGQRTGTACACALGLTVESFILGTDRIRGPIAWALHDLIMTMRVH